MPHIPDPRSSGPRWEAVCQAAMAVVRGSTRYGDRESVPAAAQELVNALAVVGIALEPVAPMPAKSPLLTERQLQVLVGMSHGLQGTEIARELGIDHNTVKRHISRVFKRLGVHSRCHAACTALRQGIIR